MVLVKAVWSLPDYFWVCTHRAYFCNLAPRDLSPDSEGFLLLRLLSHQHGNVLTLLEHLRQSLLLHSGFGNQIMSADRRGQGACHLSSFGDTVIHH